MAGTLLLSAPNLASGQGIITGSIGGTVVDQTDAVIPDATVTAVNDSTKTTLQAKTNAEGTFLISNAPIGIYTITIEASGFGMSRGSTAFRWSRATPRPLADGHSLQERPRRLFRSRPAPRSC